MPVGPTTGNPATDCNAYGCNLNGEPVNHDYYNAVMEKQKADAAAKAAAEKESKFQEMMGDIREFINRF